MGDITVDLRAEVEAHLAVAGQVSDMLPDLVAAGEALIDVFGAGGRLYVIGNGGSAADSQHFAAELVGRFRRTRRPLPALALTTDTSVLTAVANDFEFASVFARQIQALVRADDAVVAFTTSGRSRNVLDGLAEAHRIGATTILFSGSYRDRLVATPSFSFAVRSDVAARVQEAHLLLLHLLSEVIDRWADVTPGESNPGGGVRRRR